MVELNKFIQILSSKELNHVINIGSIFTCIVLLLRFVVLLGSNKIQKIFYTSEKNLLIKVCHVLLIAVPVAFFIIEILVKYFPIADSESNNIDKDTLFLTYYIVAYIISLVLVGEIYACLFADHFGKYSFYIEHEKYGKMYIAKSMNKKEVILFENQRLYRTKNSPSLYIMKKEDLKKYLITMEKSNSLDILGSLKIAYRKLIKKKNKKQM